MREIKFRGLRTDGKGWVYGCFFGANKIVEITISSDRIYTDKGSDCFKYTYHDVIPETVGQFTGLKDNNGTDIYEGDILEHYNSTFNRVEVQKVLFGWYYTDNDGRCDENVMGWVDEDGFPIDTKENKYTIIGNTHEQK